MEASFEEYLHDDNLNRTLDDNQDILEDDTKAQKDNNDARFTVAKNVVFVGAKKPVVDESVSQEHEPDADASTVIDGNSSRTHDELETPAILSQKTLKLKMIAKLEKLIHVRKVTTTIDNAIFMDKHGFSKEHSFEMAEVLVVFTATKPMVMPVNHSQLMDIVTRLDIYVKPLMETRRSVVLVFGVYFTMMNVFVFQLMCLLMQSQV